jgi:hypothetical protein
LLDLWGSGQQILVDIDNQPREKRRVISVPGVQGYQVESDNTRKHKVVRFEENGSRIRELATIEEEEYYEQDLLA